MIKNQERICKNMPFLSYLFEDTDVDPTKQDVAVQQQAMSSVKTDNARRQAENNELASKIDSNNKEIEANNKRNKQLENDVKSGSKVKAKPTKVTHEGVSIMTSSEEAVFLEALKIVLEEGERLGILNGDYLKESTEYDPLQEATFNKVSTVKLSKEGRKHWLTSRSAIAMAKAKKDPLYTKLAKATKMRRQMIEAINQKYKSQATRQARQMIKSYKLTNKFVPNASNIKAQKASDTETRIK
jgi:hypothetical protein